MKKSKVVVLATLLLMICFTLLACGPSITGVYNVINGYGTSNGNITLNSDHSCKMSSHASSNPENGRWEYNSGTKVLTVSYLDGTSVTFNNVGGVFTSDFGVYLQKVK